MSAPPYQQLARQFIDLWQKQVHTLVNDRDIIQAMLDGLEKMPGGFAAGYEQSGAKHTSGTTANAEPGAQRMAELDYRLRLCESRISQLEAALAKSSAAKRTVRKSSAVRGKSKTAKPAKRS